MKVALMVLACLACLSSAYVIEGTIDRKGTSLEFQQTSVSINGGEYTCLVDNVGRFKVKVPTPGTYRLEVQNMNYIFEPVVVEIFSEEFAPGKNIKAFLFNLRNGKDFRLAYPLVLDPTGISNYFEKKAPLDPFAYLKNPFVLMIGVTLLMSQMTKNMDKEELKKASEQQQEMMKDMPQ